VRKISFTVFLVLLGLPVAWSGLSKIMRGSVWDTSVTLVARLHIVVGLLLTVSLLL